MNNNMRNKIKFIAALFFIAIFTTTIAIAQPGGGGGGQGQGGPPPGSGAAPISMVVPYCWPLVQRFMAERR
jgi:hypothetical protein